MPAPQDWNYKNNALQRRVVDKEDLGSSRPAAHQEGDLAVGCRSAICNTKNAPSWGNYLIALAVGRISAFGRNDL
jgi:hypothetical protein